jgi:hypothetical protein
MKKKCSKNYSDHLRINKNEVYTAATLSILYKLGAMIFENICDLQIEILTWQRPYSYDLC